MVQTFHYIVGSDCCVKRSGQTKQQDVFDGPHKTPEEAHDIAKSLIVAGNYEVLPFDTPSRDTARQMYNHNLGLKVGAAAAVQNKYRLQPKTPAQQRKEEENAAWGK